MSANNDRYPEAQQEYYYEYKKEGLKKSNLVFAWAAGSFFIIWVGSLVYRFSLFLISLFGIG